MVAAETEAEVNEKLGDLLFRLGWTKREDERWECAKHNVDPGCAGELCSGCSTCEPCEYEP